MSKENDNRLFEYKDIVREKDGTLTIGSVKGVPNIAEESVGEPAAWFLGPAAENQVILTDMINNALTGVCNYRRRYPVGNPDPEVIDENVKGTDEYKDAVSGMKLAYSDLCSFLDKYATPYFSMRYQGHMLWDNTLPALAGYFATMLHNPNNVTIEASTSTTPLEIMVGWDLCQMIGFPYRKDGDPWAHITADGSIANIEAAWATRECKFLPLALQQLVKQEQEFECARSMSVTICNGKKCPLSEASAWQLLNVKMDDALAMPGKMAHCCCKNEWEVWNALALKPYSLNAIGWKNMLALTMDTDGTELSMPVMMTPSSKHYSWPKAAAVCGFGHKQMWNVIVDANGRMRTRSNGESSNGGDSVVPLSDHLQYCLENKVPVSMVVAVAGTTEEGAIDPIVEILELREKFRAKGLDFNIHVDAAWGGYVLAAIRKDYTLSEDPAKAEEDPDLPDYDSSDLFIEDVSNTWISDYVIEQYKKIRESDSVTIDPHKMGYVQYPAGSIGYRNGLIRRLTTFTGAYIGGSLDSLKPGEPTVGIFGLEGSKPGAAAAAVFLSHRVIRPSVSGHGKIIVESMRNTKLFYWLLIKLGRQSEYYDVIPLKPENERGDPRKFIEKLKNSSPQEIVASNQLDDLCRNTGPDINICDYVFNPIDENGKSNTDWDTLDTFTKAVYDIFRVSFEPPEPIEEFPKFILTMTTFERAEYGDEFIDTFAQRIGVKSKNDARSLNCLRSVVMDPYMPYAKGGSFFDEIMQVIDDGVRKLVEQWRNGTGPFKKR